MRRGVRRRRVIAPDAPATYLATALVGLLNDRAALREVRRFADIIAGLGRGDAATRAAAGLARSRTPVDRTRSRQSASANTVVVG